MEAYTVFAEVYESYMADTPYEEWCGYLAGLLTEYGIKNGLVAELGCGTGSMTRLLAKQGYDMIGIDNSEEMLAAAKKNSAEGILYLLQDMREFELYGTVKAIVSVCDSMNYILSEEELLKVFTLVNNYLDRGGIFIFDMNTQYKYQEILADNTFAENREDSSFIWENYYYEEERINEYGMTFYVKEQGELFRRYEEIHYQKAYLVPVIQGLLEKAGMELIAVYDAFTREPPEETSERIYVIAREGFCENKFYNEGKGTIE